MKRILYTIVSLLALTVTAIAQDNPETDCHIRVLVVKHDWEDGSRKTYGALSENQVRWWNDNAKKFPGVCLVAEKPADYVIAWTETFTTVAYIANVPVTTTQSGTITAANGRTVTYSGTSTTNQPQQQEWNHWWVNARLFKLNGDTAQMPELCFAKNHGRWRWSKPDQDAFEKAIKALSKRTKALDKR